MSGEPGIADVPGIQVGHATDPQAQTGCTVVLCPEGAVAGVDVRGGGPATHETDVLRPGNLVDRVHAILFTGGSAFGLGAASGVMRYLEERRIGFAFGGTHVPIVPAAALFDLGVGRADVRPTPEMAYQACRAARAGPVEEGAVGAGAGATVGNLLGPMGAMRGGVGSVRLDLAGGVTLGALVAVNAFGDVRDPASGEIIAGARTPAGEFVDTARALLEWDGPLEPVGPSTHTTLAVVATNAALTNAEATRLASVAHTGLSRVVSPAHTLFDGDVIFVLSTGPLQSNLITLGIAAGEAVARAITRAVRLSNRLT